MRFAINIKRFGSCTIHTTEQSRSQVPIWVRRAGRRKMLIYTWEIPEVSMCKERVVAGENQITYREYIMPDIMTTKEVAKYLKLHEITICKYAAEGKIPAIRIGRVWRFDKEAIDQWIRGEQKN